jgi:hypothetical protein
LSEKLALVFEGWVLVYLGQVPVSVGPVKAFVELVCVEWVQAFEGSVLVSVGPVQAFAESVLEVCPDWVLVLQSGLYRLLGL